jgi:tRNA-dihydrouridine synthase C
MKIYLAPMEGLADVHMRKLIANSGGYDLLVTEFLRVVDLLLPKKVFYKNIPELLTSSRTADGTPVRVQLLGNNPQALAENAARASELGSHGVDLNFGCPSKTVNSSKGGAVLLKEPETIFKVIKCVRDGLPKDQVLSAKMRLGFDDTSQMWECAHAIREGGANEVVVHARTKAQGYKPPAFWPLVEDFEAKLGIPVVINGEIWTPEDAQTALKQSNSSSLMLGRGAIQNPLLASQIKSTENQSTEWNTVQPLLAEFWFEITKDMSSKYCAGRLKQWLNYLRVAHKEADDLFSAIRKETDTSVITEEVIKFTEINP